MEHRQWKNYGCDDEVSLVLLFSPPWLSNNVRGTLTSVKIIDYTNQKQE